MDETPGVQGSPAPPETEGPVPEEEFDGWNQVRNELEEATRGEFEIVKELGRGGMAAVYLARDLQLGRNVAIKVMAPGLLMGAGMVERFRQEAVTIANLHHPNIVTIHTVRQEGHLHFFVMQVVEGGSLEDILDQPNLIPIHLVQTILYQLGVGLAYAHRRGVIHRDIKPANVLLDQEGNAILTDFGIAKVTTASNLTQTGSTMGTPAYMSPEQCRAAKLTNASDQYSLGVMAYEMLTGSPPFGGSPFEIMQAHVSSPPPPIREKRPDCPPELESAVFTMIAKDPKDRFPTVADAIEALGGYLPGPQDPIRAELVKLVTEGDVEFSSRAPLKPTPGRGATPSPSREMDSDKRGKRIFTWVAGLLTVAAVATVGVSTLMRGPGEVIEPVPPPTLPVSSITFANPSEEVLVGAAIQVQANLQDSIGRVVAAEAVQWSTSDPSVASAEGTAAEVTVTGVGAGSATIVAQAGNAEGSFEVTVRAPAAGELTVSAPSRELLIGSELQLTAILTDETGSRIQAPEVTWGSSNSGVLSVDSRTGVVTGRGLGRASIQASSGEESGSVTLSVVGRVDGLDLTLPSGPLVAGGIATVKADVTSRPVGYLGSEGITWTSSNPSVASVSFFQADSAVLTLLSTGETLLSAQAEGVRDAVTLRVGAPPPDITLALSSSSVAFEAMEGDSPPSPQTVSVSVTGGGTAMVEPVEYGPGGSGWLTPALSETSSGTETLTLRASVSGLAPGSYTARVPLSAGQQTQDIDVRLTVTEDPANAPVEANAASAQAITALLADYAGAINSKNTARVRELFPSLPESAVNDLLQLRETDTYVLQLVPGSLRPGSEERTLEGDVLSSVLGRGNRGEAVGMIYTFSRGQQGWYIVSLRPRN